MPTNAQILLDDPSAARTSLTGVPGTDCHNPDPGLDSLVVEQCAEHPQANVMSGAGERTVLKHEIERQIFHNDGAIAFNQFTGCLVPPVKTLIGNLFMQAREFLNGFAPVLSAFFLAGYRTLQHSQFAERGLQVFGTIQSRSVRKRKCMRDPQVQPNRRVGGLFYWLFGQLNLKQNIPAGRLVQDHDVFEFVFWQFSMPANVDQPHVLNVKALLPLTFAPSPGL